MAMLRFIRLFGRDEQTQDEKQRVGVCFYHTPDYKVAPPVKILFATGQVNGYYDSQKH